MPCIRCKGKSVANNFFKENLLSLLCYIREYLTALLAISRNPFFIKATAIHILRRWLPLLSIITPRILKGVYLTISCGHLSQVPVADLVRFISACVVFSDSV